MVGLILGIIFIIGAIIAITAGFVEQETGPKIGGVAALIFGIVSICLGCIRTVPTGVTGVVTKFGEVQPYTYEAGIHWTSPFISVIKMDNKIQKQTLQMGGPNAEIAGAFSSDIQEVWVTYTLNYQINKENAQEIYKTVGVDYYDVLIKPQVLSAVKEVVSRYNAETLIVKMGTLNDEIEQELRTNLEGTNIIVVSTALEDLDFKDAFTDAVEAKQVAEQKKLQAKTEQEQMNIEAKAAAERQVIQANADKDAAIIAAEGDAEVAKIAADSAEYQGQKDAAIMSNLGEMLTKYPNLIDYYRATGWDGKLPETMLGNGTDILFGIGE